VRVLELVGRQVEERVPREEWTAAGHVDLGEEVAAGGELGAERVGGPARGARAVGVDDQQDAVGQRMEALAELALADLERQRRIHERTRIGVDAHGERGEDAERDADRGHARQDGARPIGDVCDPATARTVYRRLEATHQAGAVDPIAVLGARPRRAAGGGRAAEASSSLRGSCARP
jgi:hypothetical protein